MKRLAIAIIFVFLSMIFVPILASTSSNANYPAIFNASISTPQYVYEGENFSIYMNATYGFPSYTGVIYVYGYNLSGVGNTTQHFADSPYSMVFNITAPMYAETLDIMGIAWTNVSSQTLTYVTTNTVQVLQPLNLSVEIRNPGSTSIHNLTANFSIDGAFVGSKVIADLAPYSTQTLTLQLAYPHLSQGLHTLTVTVNNPIASVNGGLSSYQTQFYYGTPPNYTWIYYIAAAVIAFMALLALSSGRRGARLKKPKWKK